MSSLLPLPHSRMDFLQPVDEPDRGGLHGRCCDPDQVDRLTHDQSSKSGMPSIWSHRTVSVQTSPRHPVFLSSIAPGGTSGLSAVWSLRDATSDWLLTNGQIEDCCPGPGLTGPEKKSKMATELLAGKTLPLFHFDNRASELPPSSQCPQKSPRTFKISPPEVLHTGTRASLLAQFT